MLCIFHGILHYLIFTNIPDVMMSYILLILANMRVLIFGSSGPSGIALVRKTLEVYPSSTIFLYVRSPQKIPEDLAQHPSIFVIRGQITDLGEVETALLGGPQTTTDRKDSQPVDVVLSALGPTGPFHPSDRPFAKFYTSLTSLMSKHSVKRLIVLCTASYSDPHDKFNPITYGLVTFVRTFAYRAFADFRAVGEVVRANGDKNGLEWTVVRIPVLTNDESEEVVEGYIGDGKTGNMLSRKAFAAFCIGEIEKREWVGKAPFISSVSIL